MGSSVSKAEELHKKKKDELQQLMKVLDSKREQFMSEVTANRGKAVSAKEVNGGRSVVRQSEIRVSSSDAPSKQIKEAIGSFFDAAQGGNKGRSAIINGASQLISAGIDAIFGVSAGQGMEKRGFTVLFINFAFVRVDYYVYSYCVTGTKWASTSSVAGCCQVTDLAVLDPATLNPMEIDYLIAQNITIESDGEDNSGQFEALMQIKVMLATNAVLNRIIKSPDTDFETLTKTMEQINGIMRALAGELEKLPAYESEDELLEKKYSDMKTAKEGGDKTAGIMMKFIETDLGFGDDAANWDELVKFKDTVTDNEKKELEVRQKLESNFVKKQAFAKFKKSQDKRFDKLESEQRLAITKLFGYGEDDWNNYDPDLKDPGTAQMGLLGEGDDDTENPVEDKDKFATLFDTNIPAFTA